MPACDNCGGNDYTLIDGKFYCTDCDTQSQHFVDERAPELLADSTFTTKLLRKKVVKEKSQDFGRVWYTVEGYQLVIKAHVHALIDIGVTPKVEDVLKQIWFKYVHITGMAVIDSNLKTTEVPDSNLSLRDFFFKHHSKDDAGISYQKMKRKHSKNTRKNDGAVESDSEWFSSEADASSNEEDALSTSSCPPISRFSRPKRSKKWIQQKSMSLTKVIAFCYLAIRWTKDLFTVGDLMYWAESGRIPYYDAGSCFPADMKLFQGDDRTFIQVRVLKYHEIVWSSRRLHCLIGMPQLPEVNVLSLVGRYLYQLNLPLDFIPYAFRIVNDIAEASWPKQNITTICDISVLSFKLPDLIAVSVVAILLKLCFVLDGRTEWLDTKEVSCHLHEDCSPFSWKVWIRQHLKYSMESTDLLDSSFQKMDIDLHACMEHYSNVVLKGFSHKAERVCGSISKAREFQEARELPFKRLVELQGSMPIMHEKCQERIYGSGIVKLLGRKGESCSGNMTSSCVNHLMELEKQDAKYIIYRSPVGNETLHDLSPSYAFLLCLLAEITKANWKSIHEYIVTAEERLFPSLLNK